MLSDEDELYTKVVVLNEIYKLCCSQLFSWSCFDAEIFDSQDFIELIPKESIGSIVTRKCVVLGKDFRWRNNQNKVVDIKNLCKFLVGNFFIWNHLSNKNYIWIPHIWNLNFSNDHGWRNDQNKSCRSWKAMQLCSW